MNVRRGYVPNCVGRIVELHARYYGALVGARLAFEQRGTQWGAEVNEQRFELQG